jgi:hypothetical protein
MKVSIVHAATILTATVAVTGVSPSAFADPPETTTMTTEAQPAAPAVQPAPAPQTVIFVPSGRSAPRDSVSETERTPNAAMITSGAILFGIPYTASVIVGASSPNRADRNLIVPVIGPWIDLANRSVCVGAECPNETTNKVMLVASGVLQTVGVLDFVGGFVFPVTRTTTRTAKAAQSTAVHVLPTAFASSVGLAAFGRF